jgi:hypothetical protein
MSPMPFCGCSARVEKHFTKPRTILASQLTVEQSKTTTESLTASDRSSHERRARDSLLVKWTLEKQAIWLDDVMMKWLKKNASQ